MKKLFIATLLLGGVYLAWRRYAEDHDERDLWDQVTDAVD